MFEHFTLGTQVHPCGPNDADISPEDRQRRPAAATARASSISQADPPPNSTDTEPPPISPASTTNAAIDTLAHKLSEQHLRRDSAAIVQARQIQLPQSPALSDQSIAPPCPDLEMDLDPAEGLSVADGKRPSSVLSTSPPLPSLMEVHSRQPSFTVDPTRLRRQQSTHFHNNPANTRTIQTLVEDMIAKGDQCTVYSPPMMPSPAGFIEADVPMSLEVDEDADNLDNLDMAWMEQLASLRAARGPGGIRKSGLLRYRLSADVAAQSPNVVRSRPRMRRRRKVHRDRDADRDRERDADSVASSNMSGSPAPASPAFPPAPAPAPQ